MTTDLRKAAEQALDALECPPGGRDMNQLSLAVADASLILRAALVSDASAPVGLPAGESTGPVAGASTRAAHNPNPLGGPATRFRVVADRLEAGEDYAAVLKDLGLADVPAKPVRAALAEPQTTHSAECYKWHHGCAIAEVERLRGAKPAEPVAWEMDADGRTIQDSDFTHDVVLRLDGDFESDEQRIAYTQRIVDKLNAPTPSKPVELSDEEIKCATSSERDSLLDHIYEYGTAAEGVLERINKLARAVIAAVMKEQK